MSAPDLNIAMVLRLVDKMTAPARAAIQQVDKIGAATERAGRRGVAWSNNALKANQDRIAGLQREGLEVAAMGYALYKALQPAIQFEAAMAGVSKVIDFNRKNGINRLGDDILKLTSSGGLPMAAEGIAEIIEAAGQAGIVDAALPDDEKRAQLIAFAEDAAKMGVAFDISAGAAGEAMAQWRAAMKLTHAQSIGLGDAINHLSNNMNASAPFLVDVVRRQGAVAMQAGLAETEVAALAAAFLAGGASPEIAATALKNFTGALTKGEAMTKRQRKVMNALGLDAEDLAKRMQVDAKGAIIEVMEKLAELPDYQKAAALGQLFGEESKGAIAPLLTNLDNLRDAFALVATPSEYAGAMLEEYQKQAETTANQIKITTGFVNAMAVTVGTILLPELNDLLALVQPVIAQMAEWAKAHPELVKWGFRAVVMLIAFKLASIALRLPLLLAWKAVLMGVRVFSYLLLAGGKVIRFAMLFARGALFLARGPLVVLTKAVMLLGRAFLLNPIGAAITAVAALAYVVYDNWDNIVEYFTAKIDRVYQAFDEGLFSGLAQLFAEFNHFQLIYDALDGLAAYLLDFLPDFAWSDILPDWHWSDIVPDLSFAFDWVDVLPDWDWSSIVPEMPSFSFFGGSSTDGARALGGGVFAGRTYQVNERGMELFTPSTNGRIIPNRDLFAGGDRGGGSTTVGDIHIYPAPGQNPAEIARAVRAEMEAQREGADFALHDGGGYD